MYFKSRIVAGQELADKLVKYKGTNTAAIALSEGGSVVAMQIAAKLHCLLMMLLTAPIELPGEPDPLASIDQEGIFTYNPQYSVGELEDFDMEYHHYVEMQKLTKLQRLHRLLGSGGLIRKDLLKEHNIILVSDGLSSGFSVEAAVNYLKTIKVNKVIAATPLASVEAVDRLHTLTDEIYCLSVIDNFIDTNHYYDDNHLPSRDNIMKIINDIALYWY